MIRTVGCHCTSKTSERNIVCHILAVLMLRLVISICSSRASVCQAPPYSFRLRAVLHQSSCYSADSIDKRILCPSWRLANCLKVSTIFTLLKTEYFQRGLFALLQHCFRPQSPSWDSRWTAVSYLFIGSRVCPACCFILKQDPDSPVVIALSSCLRVSNEAESIPCLPLSHLNYHTHSYKTE